MRILVLGASGMLGNAMLRVLARDPGLEVHGSVRNASVGQYFETSLAARLVSGVDVDNADCLTQLFARLRPDVVINCVGLVKQIAAANDPILALSINSILPHRLARLCDLASARLIHVSTDCVFSGGKGGYVESDPSDALDLYGRSKLLGEVAYPHTITLRTSIIGRELNGSHGLIGWFLGQQGAVSGYTRAVFSGLPTCELARVVRDFVLPQPDLHGVYHVAADPISKYALLQLVNSAYGKHLDITPDASVQIDRSLNGGRFRAATGYVAPSWPELVQQMQAFL